MLTATASVLGLLTRLLTTALLLARLLLAAALLMLITLMLAALMLTALTGVLRILRILVHLLSPVCPNPNSNSSDERTRLEAKCFISTNIDETKL